MVVIEGGSRSILGQNYLAFARPLQSSLEALGTGLLKMKTLSIQTDQTLSSIGFKGTPLINTKITYMCLGGVVPLEIVIANMKLRQSYLSNRSYIASVTITSGLTMATLPIIIIAQTARGCGVSI